MKSIITYCLLVLINFANAKGQNGVEFRVTVKISEELSRRGGIELDDFLAGLCKLLDKDPLITPSYCTEKAAETNQEVLDVYSFRDFWEANDFKNFMKDHGYPSALIVAYQDNQPVLIKDILNGAVTNLKKDGAEQRIDNQPVFEEKGIVFRILLNPKAEMENQSISAETFTKKLCKLISSYSSNEWNLSEFDCSELEKHMRDKPEQFFVFKQSHPDYWEVDALKKLLREQGFKSSFLVGYKDGRRTPIKDLAEELGW